MPWLAPYVLINYVGYVGPGLTRGRILSTCVLSTWSNDIKCKYMFMFPLKNLALQGLIWIVDANRLSLGLGKNCDRKPCFGPVIMWQMVPWHVTWLPGIISIERCRFISIETLIIEISSHDCLIFINGNLFYLFYQEFRRRSYWQARYNIYPKASVMNTWNMNDEMLYDKLWIEITQHYKYRSHILCVYMHIYTQCLFPPYKLGCISSDQTAFLKNGRR